MKLIVIDGNDGSGKQTQAELTVKRLKEEGVNVSYVSFPNYQSPYCSLVKGYLNGDFGSDPSSVPAKVSSLFYAMDRYASMKTDGWMNADVVIVDRYTTSNMVHQAAKLPYAEREDYFDWLQEMEYKVLGIPVPDRVIFLDVPPKVSLSLRTSREGLKNGESKDIHESNYQFMKDSYNSAVDCSERFGWDVVHCAPDGESMRSIESINDEVYNIVKGII